MVSSNQPPATPTLSTPWDFQRGGPWTSTLRPEFTFSTTDANGDTIQYNIVVDDDPAFGSLDIDATSTAPTGWSGTPPYASGASVTYTTQSDLTSGTTYWWKVRAIDPAGSNTWSLYNSSQSVTVQSGWTEQSWFQTTKAQFDKDTLSNAQTTTSGGGALEPILSAGSWGTSANTYSIAVEGNRLVSYNGWIINTGGYYSTTYADMQKAQVQSDGNIGAWSATTSLPAVRAYHGAAVYNGYIYVVGGSADGAFTYTTTVYYATIDSSANVGAWNTAANALPDGWGLGELAICNGYMYIIGGYNNTYAHTNAVYYSQIGVGGQPGAWTLTTALPAVRSRINFDNLVYNGRVYIPGGDDGGGAGSTTVYYASCGSGPISSWSMATNGLPENRLRHSAAMDTDSGKLYVLGGTGVATTRYASINPSTGNIDAAWIVGSDLPAVRRYEGAAYTSSQTSIHVVCGGDSSGVGQTSVYYLKLGAGSGSATSTTILYSGGPSSKMTWNSVIWNKDTSGGGTATVAVQKYTSSWVWTGLEGSNSVNSLSITSLNEEAQIRLVANLSGVVKLLDWDVSWLTGPYPSILSLDVRHASVGVGDGGRLYAGHTEEFVTDVKDPQGPTNVQYVDLRIDGTENYLARWSEATDAFSEQAGGTEYELLSTGADSSYSGNTWTLVFKIKFSWDLSWADTAKDPAVYMIDDDSNTDLDTFTTETFSVENDLVFSGSITATGQYKGPFSSGSWVQGGEQITWGGSTIRYEGSTVSPLDPDFDLRVIDDDTGSWTQSTGALLNLVTNADASDDSSDIHSIDVINVPTGGTAPSTQTFEVKVDATDPTAPTGVTPTPASWTSTNSFSVDWTDPADLSGIATGAYYKLDSVPTSDTDGTWLGAKPMTAITVAGDGAHTIYVWLKDNAGNINYQNYGSTTLYFDSSGPAFTNYEAWNSASWVALSEWIPDQTPDARVTITVSCSGIDVSTAEYRYSTDGTMDTETWGAVTGVYTDAAMTIPASDGATGTLYIKISGIPFNQDHATNNLLQVRASKMTGSQSTGSVQTVKIDATDPSSPTGLGATPVSWTATNSFDVDWTNPADTSGIVTGAYYKLDAAPTSDTDGTWIAAKPISGITVGSAGSHAIYVWLKDNAGNINYLNYATTTLYYDPTPTSFTAYAAQRTDLSWVALTEWVNDQTPDVRATISADLSGVDVSTAEYRFSTDGVMDAESWQAATGVYTDAAMTVPASDGATGTLYIKLSGVAFNQDHATNNLIQVRVSKMSTATGTSASQIVKIDTTAPPSPVSPTADGSNPSPWKNTATFSISWTDPADLSGIASACYKLTTAPTSNSDGTCDQTKPFNVNAPSEGTHTVYVWLKDVVGNINYQNNATVTIRYDITSPGLPSSMTANGGSPSPWTNVNSFSIDWSNPTDASGIAGGYYKLSQPTNNGDGTYSTSKPIPSVTVPGEGEHTLYLFLKDSAGNANHQNNNTVVLRYDATAPNAPTSLTADGSDPSPWKNTSSFSIDWTPPADVSGIAGWYYKMYTAPTSPTDGTYSTSKPFIASPPTDGPLTLYLWMKDNAGNVDHTKRATVTIRYDATPPTTVNDLSSPKVTGTTIRLAWGMPTEPNFLKYEVYYNTTPGIDILDRKWDDSNDSGLAAITGNTTTITGLSDSTTYYFRVRAIDLASNKATLSNELTKATIEQRTLWHLRNGANFAAVTCNPPSWTAYALGKSITQNVTPGKATEIMKWNSVSQSWESVTSADGINWFGTDFSIVNGGGYVIKVTGVTAGGVDYTFTGSEILLPVTLTLKEGLTLSGIPFSNTSYTSYSILQKIREQNLARTVSVEIKYWDPAQSRYVTATYSEFMGEWQFSGDLYAIEAERGYFIVIDLTTPTPDATFNP